MEGMMCIISQLAGPIITSVQSTREQEWTRKMGSILKIAWERNLIDSSKLYETNNDLPQISFWTEAARTEWTVEDELVKKINGSALYTIGYLRFTGASQSSNVLAIGSDNRAEFSFIFLRHPPKTVRLATVRRGWGCFTWTIWYSRPLRAYHCLVSIRVSTGGKPQRLRLHSYETKTNLMNSCKLFELRKLSFQFKNTSKPI